MLLNESMHESRRPISFTMLHFYYQEKLYIQLSLQLRTYKYDSETNEKQSRLHRHDKRMLYVIYEAVTNDLPRLIPLLPPNELRMHPRKTVQSHNERSKKWQRHCRGISTDRMPGFWTVAWCSAWPIVNS